MRPERIAELLPDVVQRTITPGSVTDDLLEVMDLLHEPVETVLADFGRFVDPYRCPSRFVPMLAQWVGYGWLLPDGDDYAASIAEGPLRNLIHNAATLAKDRGTRRGLVTTLELATGQPGFVVDDMAGTAFGIAVRCPESARADGRLIKRIIGHDKPAFAVAFVSVGDEPLVPLADFVASETRSGSVGEIDE